MEAAAAFEPRLGCCCRCCCCSLSGPAGVHCSTHYTPNTLSTLVLSYSFCSPVLSSTHPVFNMSETRSSHSGMEVDKEKNADTLMDSIKTHFNPPTTKANIVISTKAKLDNSVMRKALTWQVREQRVDSGAVCTVHTAHSHCLQLECSCTARLYTLVQHCCLHDILLSAVFAVLYSCLQVQCCTCNCCSALHCLCTPPLLPYFKLPLSCLPCTLPCCACTGQIKSEAGGLSETNG